MLALIEGMGGNGLSKQSKVFGTMQVFSVVFHNTFAKVILDLLRLGQKFLSVSSGKLLATSNLVHFVTVTEPLSNCKIGLFGLCQIPKSLEFTRNTQQLNQLCLRWGLNLEPMNIFMTGKRLNQTRKRFSEKTNSCVYK